jgi:hypothetical protein
VFEAGDTLDELEAALGFTPPHNDGVSYGDPDFTPAWEWINPRLGMDQAS